ncbi:MAG: ammonia-forming cytochrome c nitrite reductase [Ignavibacteriae bacterium]|nr:ammonia-forming cytochrome c nitrite reductase [Ignavibacteriota bacterium]NOG96427.1 ammonia-forming cytochrome c nitrite reductase [Ignavibacteriota bacterium]
MSSTNDGAKRKPITNWFLFIVTVVVVFLIGMFASSIIERKAEGVYTLQMVKPIPEDETRNEVWGANFPREYETYMQTLETDFASEHGGSKKIDYLETYPELVVLWAGYGFSKDYNQGRGHAYAIEDLRNTLRTGGESNDPMPATCWACKGPDVPRVMKKVGVTEFYAATWKERGDQIVNPIGCADCHDNETMNLKITRPALAEAFERQGVDMSKFTRNEMRSLVCAQCHVEYYFNTAGHDGVPYLTFPWDNGFSADDMEKYYDDLDFSDWTHQLSKAPMLKAQHPDYELYMTGIHAKRGVSCADCHMPYKSEGGVKFTDHHVQSPLNNVANSCQVCHREKTEDLVRDVYERQERLGELRRIAEVNLAAAHLEAKIAWDNGATKKEMKDVLTLLRHSQWRWDWVAAANGFGFHSPVEALRVLGTSIDKAQQARKELALILVGKGVGYPVKLPDISTKAKAQKVIGLDVDLMIKDKEEFLQTTAKEWDRKAKERQGTLVKY